MRALQLDDTATLIAHLSATREVYAPVEQAGEHHWLRVDGSQAPPVDPAQRPVYSPKQLFFAEHEPLYVFRDARFVARLPDPPPQALVGVHACDLTAIAYMDRFFADDAHYRARRRATLLVGIDCDDPCEHGFCHVVDAGPAVRDGHGDLVLTRVGRAPDAGWLLLVMSEAGGEAVASLALPEAGDDWARLREEAARGVEQRFGDCSHLEAGMARLDAGTIDADTWEALGIQCVACSGCTTMCPTCSCHAPVAEGTPAGAVHGRVWDSCLFEGFQREASGAHPAHAPGMRVERYWFHKLGAPFREQYGRPTCVGCGRCEQVCPGSIGVHSVMRRLAAP